MPPSTLRFFDDEAFTKLAQATPQGLATDIGLDSSLDFNGLCVVDRLGGHERLSRCRITGRVWPRGLASPPGLYVLETHEPWRVGGVAAAVTVDGAGFDRATDCLGGDPNSGGGGGEGCPRRSSGIWSFVAGLVIHVLISALLPWRTEFGGFDHWIIIALVFRHPSTEWCQRVWSSSVEVPLEVCVLDDGRGDLLDREGRRVERLDPLRAI